MSETKTDRQGSQIMSSIFRDLIIEWIIWVIWPRKPRQKNFDNQYIMIHNEFDGRIFFKVMVYCVICKIN